MGDEVGIGAEEQVVPARMADQHDARVERHRARLGRGGDRRPAAAMALLDADLAVAQGRLEHRPELGVGGDRLGAQHQHAAIGAVEGAGTHEREIGGERALFLAVVDAAEHRLVAGIGLDDDGRRLGVGVVDQQVDRVAPLHRLEGGGHLLGGHGDQQRHALDQVDAHLGEPAREAGLALELADHLVEQRAGGLLRDLPRERIAPARQLGLLRGEPEVDGLGLGAEALRVGRRDRRLGRAGRPREDHAALAFHRLEPVRARRRAQRLDALGGLGAQHLGALPDRVLEAVGGERARQRLAQPWHERREAVAEPAADALRQEMRARPARLREIVEVDPVAGGGPSRQRLGEELERGRHAPAAVLAEHEDVEARLAQREPEGQRLARARVAGEVEGVRVGARGRDVEGGQAQFPRRYLHGRHAASPLRERERAGSHRGRPAVNSPPRRAWRPSYPRHARGEVARARAPADPAAG